MSHPYDMGDKKKVSVLGPTLKFKGELSASEDLLILVWTQSRPGDYRWMYRIRTLAYQALVD